MGKDGKMKTEKYYSNNIAHKGKDGNTISQRHEGYKNSNGATKMAQQKMLNN